MKVIPYSDKDSTRWDLFVPRAAQGTVIHSRKFIGYHLNRFKDVSLLIVNEKGNLRGLFVAAISPNNPKCIISHPGLTYGGLLHEPNCRAEEVMDMLAAILDWYRKLDYLSILYKSVPFHIHKQVVQTDHYALWRENSKLVRRDLWNVIDLKQPRIMSKGHAWSYKKAIKTGLQIFKLETSGIGAFHALLDANLRERHDTKPVHSLVEIEELQRRLPADIETWGCQTQTGELLAATWIFKLHSKCWHTQYIASNSHGRELFASDLLLEEIIDCAVKDKVDYFSFGSSTDNGGKELNNGLFGFKAGFGPGSVVQDFYEVLL
jgi:hypothetical protein